MCLSNGAPKNNFLRDPNGLDVPIFKLIRVYTVKTSLQYINITITVLQITWGNRDNLGIISHISP